jgi:hypothetical protein
MALGLLADSISFDRKCCPFFEFRIDIAPNSSPVWLSLTGCPGVKAGASLSWNRTIAAVKGARADAGFGRHEAARRNPTGRLR